MFQISDVRIYNFRSFRGKHAFKLPTAPGLYYVTGTNEFEPALDANGAGKSTLLEAIYWCFYGRTTRGLRGPDIVTWHEKSAWVEVDVTVGDAAFTVSRVQSPNSLTIKNGGTLIVEQDELEKRLRLSPEAFKYGVMTPQYGKSFFERSPTEKLEVFSDILNLDIWLERSKAADKEATLLEREKERTAYEIETVAGNIISAGEEIEKLAARNDNFKAEQAAQRRDLEDELAEVKEAKRKAHVAKQVGPLSAKVEGHERRLKELLAKIDTKVAEQAQIIQDTVRVTANFETIKAQADNLKGLSARCPTCLQPVDAKHISRERNALLDKLDVLAEQRKELRASRDELESVIDALKGDRRRVEADLTAARDRQRAEAQATGQAEAAYRAATQRVADLEGRLGTLNAATSPYASLMAEKRGAIEGLKARKTKLVATLAKIEAEHYAVSYWVTGFKRLRLMIIEDTLRSLEIEVNNSLTSLGLNDWSIALDVEREKKSGGVTKGFHVFVQCPAYDQPVKWESWSGGETQRLQQAGDFGMSNLIMLQAGLQGTIEFYDEPSQHLSTAGLLDLAETLHQRAMTQGKVILLIDHHTIDFGEFAGVCRITKDDEGSYFGPWE